MLRFMIRRLILNLNYLLYIFDGTNIINLSKIELNIYLKRKINKNMIQSLLILLYDMVLNAKPCQMDLVYFSVVDFFLFI